MENNVKIWTSCNAGKGLGTSWCFPLCDKVQKAWVRGCIREFLKWDTRTVQHMVVNAERKDC